jgi:hypothetical protein
VSYSPRYYHLENIAFNTSFIIAWRHRWRGVPLLRVYWPLSDNWSTCYRIYNWQNCIRIIFCYVLTALVWKVKLLNIIIIIIIIIIPCRFWASYPLPSSNTKSFSHLLLSLLDHVFLYVHNKIFIWKLFLLASSVDILASFPSFRLFVYPASSVFVVTLVVRSFPYPRSKKPGSIRFDWDTSASGTLKMQIRWVNTNAIKKTEAVTDASADVGLETNTKELNTWWCPVTTIQGQIIT